MLYDVVVYITNCKLAIKDFFSAVTILNRFCRSIDRECLSNLVIG